MARDERPREDLLAEATALVERVRFYAPRFVDPVVAGFRPDGCLSIYFGESPAYHFNSARELRRAFVDGELIKADRRRLVVVRRQSIAGRIKLCQRELAPDDAASFVCELDKQLCELAASLAAGEVRDVVQVPPGANVLDRLGDWLAQRAQPVGIAAEPHAR